MQIKELIDTYKDEKGYISNITSLFYEMDNRKIPLIEIYEYIQQIYKDNKRIIEEIDKENKRMKSIISNKEETLQEKEETKTKGYLIEPKIKEKKYSDLTNIKFYKDYIEENLENNKYLEILPTNNDQESIKIIDMILIYYLKELNYIKNFLNSETKEQELNKLKLYLITYNDIFETIKKYKANLLYIKEEQQKNEIVYFMKNDIPYIINDLKGEESSYKSICTLIESIENGKFKNPKIFTSNEKFKGIIEVRDLDNQTRIFFTSLGNRKYCVFYCIADKKETNKSYKEALYNRYRLFKESTILYESANIKSLLMGE